MKAYYNEHDKFCAQWLRNLIAAGHIADGDVDDRDIQEVKPDDLEGYTQVHLFAGIGGWSYALRLAGWPDDRPVWTGSCPCQPFSCAGKRKGKADPRHLWPEMWRLVAKRRPAVVLGEQVASADGCEWLAGVFADLDAMGYRVAGADLCAAGVGSPQIRQRSFWLADRKGVEAWAEKAGDVLRVPGSAWANGVRQAGGCCSKHRRVRRRPPAVRLVADGVSENVARLCGAGNAIVPQVAAEFIAAYMEASNDCLALTAKERGA